MLKQKRLYNRETIKGVRISQWAEILQLHHDWQRSLNKEKGQSFELH